MTSILSVRFGACVMKHTVVIAVFLIASAAEAAANGEEDNKSNRGAQTFGEDHLASQTRRSFTVVDWNNHRPFGGNRTIRNVITPVYVKVPVRVPVRLSKLRRRFARKTQLPRTSRYYIVSRPMSLRRKLITYNPKPFPVRRRLPYIVPKYHKTTIHDLDKTDAYYPLRGRGYEVTEYIDDIQDTRPSKLTNQ